MFSIQAFESDAEAEAIAKTLKEAEDAGIPVHQFIPRLLFTMSSLVHEDFKVMAPIPRASVVAEQMIIERDPIAEKQYEVFVSEFPRWFASHYSLVAKEMNCTAVLAELGRKVSR